MKTNRHQEIAIFIFKKYNSKLFYSDMVGDVIAHEAIFNLCVELDSEDIEIITDYLIYIDNVL